MRWEDERYVRVYVRDTAEWLALGWEAQALLVLLLRKADRAGIVQTGKAGVRGVAALAGMPLDVVQRALPVLLDDGCLRAMDAGGYVFPNFLQAQEARSSDAQRKREQRARDRDKAVAGGAVGSVTGLDAEARMSRAAGQNTGHASHHEVTPGSRFVTDVTDYVTPSRTVPCLAVPPSALQGAADATPSVEQAVLVDVAPAEKPKRAPNTSAMGEFIDWARAETKPRLPADALDPAAGMKGSERTRLGEAVKLHGLEALKAAFRLFMGWEVAQQKGYSVGFFANGWERWVQQAKATPARNFGTAKAENKPNTPNILELEARWKAARQ